MSKNINYPLILGGLIVLVLAILSFYPEWFTDKDPLYEENPKYIQYQEDGQVIEEFSHNPMRPNKENVFGTDDAGRDLYARLIYGTKNTMHLILLIAVFRMLIALPLGLAAGMGLRFLSEIIKIFNTFFTAIPRLVISFFILNMTYFRAMEMDRAIVFFTIVLTLLGWSSLAGLIEDNVRRVMSEDFIEGELAIGKTQLQIAYQNIIPHIIPSSVSLFFKEMAMALFLLAQLAVLYVFVGLVREIKEHAFRANFEMILEPEWGGTLSRITSNIGRFHVSYWLTLYPVLAFTIGTLGLNLFGEGLRIEFSKRNSRIISLIKKLFYQLSPRLLVEGIKEFRTNYRPLAAKALIIIIIIGYFSIQWHPSTYDFEMDMAMLHINELSSDKYEDRIVASEGGYLAGDYIIDILESYGYETSISEIPLDSYEDEPYPGRNISGFLPGKGRTKDDPGEIIIIGSIYGRERDFSNLNPYYEEDDPELSPIMTLTPIGVSLEIARVLSLMDEPLEKSIEFIFWDNETEIHLWGPSMLGGSGYLNLVEQRSVNMAMNHGYYYIDITVPGYIGHDVLEFVVLPSQRPDTDGQSYLIGLDMEKRFKQLGIKYKRYHYPEYASGPLKAMRLNAIATLGLGSPYITIPDDMDLDDIENINIEKLENMGQAIIDTLTMDPRIME